MKIQLLLFGVFPLILLGCHSDKKTKPNTSIPPKYAITSEPVFSTEGTLVFIGQQNDSITTIDIELAATPQDREMGLMYRRKMDGNQGMFFVFDTEERQSFWMKNTHIPLDIIFVSQTMRVVHIAENCIPYSLDQIPSFEYAKYVVEVNAGFSKKFGLKPGYQIRVEVF